MGEQVLHEVAADKATGTADDCLLSFEVHFGGRTPFQRFTRLKVLNYLRLSGASGSNAPRLLFSIAGGGVVFRVTLLGEGAG
jgi:hypothetical protein